jgi:hypothetical protein
MSRFSGEDDETVRKRVTLSAAQLDCLEEMYPEAMTLSEAVRSAVADGIRARKKYQGHFDDGDERELKSDDGEGGGAGEP